MLARAVCFQLSRNFETTSALRTDSHPPYPPREQGTGFLGVRPRTGISRGNLAAFYMCSAFSVCSFVVMAAAQPNLLRILLADDGEREGGRRSGGVEDGTANIGSVTGNFVLVAELTILTCSGPWGVVSDIYGRRFVWSVGESLPAS
eukprot:3837529-Rhodomonas_salina.2